MLSEMSRQILKTQTQLQEFADARLPHIETGNMELRFERVGLILVFKVANESCQALQCLHIKTEHLTDFSRCRPAAIRNDIRSHGGAKHPIALIDVLNRTLALIAAGKIKIDDAPSTAL